MNGAGRDARARRDAAPASPRMNIDVRSTALFVLAASAIVALLWWAQAVFVPIVLAVLISHALEPAVAFLEHRRCPRPLGVFLVLSCAVVAIGYGVYALAEPASTFIDQMPVEARTLRTELERHAIARSSPFQRVQQAANEIERAATSAARPAPAPAGVQRVRIEEPPFHLGDLAWRGSRGLIEFLSAAVIVFFLTYYLLLAGDSYRRKLASIAGPSFHRKRLALQVLIDIDEQIRRFLLARLSISLIVAVATGAALAALGLKQAIMWGVVSGILNTVPYVGPLVAIAAITMAGFAQFGTLAQTAAVAGAAALVAFLEGNILTPRLTSHAGGVNTVAIFAGILFWGWLWGVWGMLLAVPIMTAMRAACARIDELQAIAEFLGE
ncbi:MAG TPA: AI-2E family transporter [Vicinamibacterales bacterium]|nr:AI-2E family transporter [Vicinamibacterales bacterium]